MSSSENSVSPSHRAKASAIMTKLLVASIDLIVIPALDASIMSCISNNCVFVNWLKK
jgi:hypothetical protein